MRIELPGGGVGVFHEGRTTGVGGWGLLMRVEGRTTGVGGWGLLMRVEVPGVGGF